MKRALLAYALLGTLGAAAQIDSSLFVRERVPDSTAQRAMNMDAVYNRPFLTLDKAPVSLGGYVEAKAEHLGTKGVGIAHAGFVARLACQPDKERPQG